MNNSTIKNIFKSCYHSHYRMQNKKWCSLDHCLYIESYDTKTYSMYPWESKNLKKTKLSQAQGQPEFLLNLWTLTVYSNNVRCFTFIAVQMLHTFFLFLLRTRASHAYAHFFIYLHFCCAWMKEMLIYTS